MISYSVSKDWPYHVSSGGAVFNGDQILLLLRNDDGKITYHLPKGTLEPNESLEQAAIREILEESGADVELVGYLGSVNTEFVFNELEFNKVNHYFAAKLKSDKLQDMDSEHDSREWVPIDEAEALLKLNDNSKQEWLIITRLKAWLELNPENG